MGMYNFVGDTFCEVYTESAKELINYGDESSPREKKIKELMNVSFCITDPKSRIAYVNGRGKGFNLCYAIVESLMLVNSRNDLRYFSLFNENIKNFSDNGETLRGCYGSRISSYIGDIICKLRRDNDTRQAVLSIYHNDYDIDAKTKDVPCTETLQFFIRDNLLHMIVNMRSNDILWGLPYDVFMFTSLQEVIANTLEVDLGCYYHNVGSFHVYEEFYEVVENIGKIGGNYSIYCNALEGIGLDKYKDISEKYVKCVDGKHDYADYTAMDDYSRIIAKELMYRKVVEGKKEFEGISLGDNHWSRMLTKRWRDI